MLVIILVVLFILPFSLLSSMGFLTNVWQCEPESIICTEQLQLPFRCSYWRCYQCPKRPTSTNVSCKLDVFLLPCLVIALLWDAWLLLLVELSFIIDSLLLYYVSCLCLSNIACVLISFSTCPSCSKELWSYRICEPKRA